MLTSLRQANARKGSSDCRLSAGILRSTFLFNTVEYVLLPAPSLFPPVHDRLIERRSTREQITALKSIAQNGLTTAILNEAPLRSLRRISCPGSTQH